MDEILEKFRPIDKNEKFNFDCHPNVKCFTECCCELDLELSPYDVLRLKNRLKMSSGIFLEKYVIIEWNEKEPFPHCYLTMVDDGKVSCIFKTARGCKVYSDRPSACRSYPVGRGASHNDEGRISVQYVLVQERHCQGFLEPARQDCIEYAQKQGLEEYNRINDIWASLVKHSRVKQGFKPTRQQLDQYILALYNLDLFRQKITEGEIVFDRPLNNNELLALAGDDEKMLLFGINWILETWFVDQISSN